LDVCVLSAPDPLAVGDRRSIGSDQPPPDHTSSIRDHYFDVRKAVFGLLAVWVTLGAIMDSIGAFKSTQPLNPELPIGLMYSIRGAALLVFVFMAWSDRESHHWTGFTVAALIQIAWIPGVSYSAGAVQQAVAAGARQLAPIDPWYRSGGGSRAPALAVSAVGRS